MHKITKIRLQRIILTQNIIPKNLNDARVQNVKREKFYTEALTLKKKEKSMWKNMTFEFESMEQFQPKRQGKIPVAERVESSFREPKQVIWRMRQLFSSSRSQEASNTHVTNKDNMGRVWR